MHFGLLLVLFMPMQYLATVTGQVLDREAKPIVGAAVTYRQIGIMDRDTHSDAGMRWESPRIGEGTGRSYQAKTDKKGAFAITGVEPGIYEIQIVDAEGNRVYAGKKTIDQNGDPNAHNVLNVDLSTTVKGVVEPGAGANRTKLTKEQRELMEQESENAPKINRLLADYHSALNLEDTTTAIDKLQQLIAVDPHRWEFYQNLGRLQENRQQYKEAAQNFAKGVEEARKILANPADTDKALNNLGDLLISEAECYDRMDQMEKAVALYKEAAATFPHPFMAHYRACDALNSRGQTDAAIEECTAAIGEDPNQFGPYQTLGAIFTTNERRKDALAVYQAGIAAAQKELAAQPDSPSTKAGLGQLLNAEGNLLSHMNHIDAAISAFKQATEVAAYPAMPWFNLCAMYYNQQKTDDALAACEHALSSDPTMADAHYIRGTILFGRGKAEHGRYAVPPGTLESLNSYLQFAPTGEHVSTVRSMIQNINHPVESSLKPAKK